MYPPPVSLLFLRAKFPQFSVQKFLSPISALLLIMFIIFLSLFFFFFCFFFLFFFSFLQKLNKNYSTSSYHNGPISYPIIGCLISFYKNRRRLLNWYTELLTISPTQTIAINRLGARRTIVTANPDNVEYILKTNFNNYPKGKPFTEILGDLLGCGIFNVDGDLWYTQRKLASHEFSTKTLREFVVKTLDEEVKDRLVPLLEKAAEENSVLDLQDVLKRFAFDTICKVSLGTDPCCLDLSRPVPDLVKAFDIASEISARRGMAPVFLVWKIKRFLGIGSEKTLKENVKMVHGSVLEIINEKKRLLKENKGDMKLGSDLLSRLLLAGHNEKVVRDIVISFIMAGRDTTSSTMTWLFWLLSQNSNTEKKLVNEIESVLQSTNGALNYEVLQDFEFLKACLCESMRLYPPVAWDSKHARNDDVLPDGNVVKKGNRVTYFPYGMGRMKKIWGEDRFEFKPDRWFEEQVNPYKFPVFQAGPRVCLGKEMAYTQMKYVVASVLKRFEFKPVCLDRPVYIPLLTAHMVGGLKVFVRKRSDK